MRREVDLVDHEQVGVRDCGAAFCRNFVAAGNVDHVDRRVGEIGAEGRSKVVPAAFDDQQAQVRETRLEFPHRFEIHRGVFADRGVRAAAGFDGEDALGRQASAAGQDLRVLAGVDVVGDDGQVDARVERARQAFDQRRLAGADRSADADTYRAHDANNRPSSQAWRIASISHAIALALRSSRDWAAAAVCAPAAIASRSDHKSLPTSRWPSGTARAAAAANMAAVELR